MCNLFYSVCGELVKSEADRGVDAPHEVVFGIRHVKQLRKVSMAGLTLGNSVDGKTWARQQEGSYCVCNYDIECEYYY